MGVQRERARLLNLNTGKIDHNSIELTKKAFFALTNIYASKHSGRACCLHYPAFCEVSKYQIADKLHIMQLAHCCAIFDIFIFIPFPGPPPKKIREFLTFSSQFTARCVCRQIPFTALQLSLSSLLLFVHLMC